MFILKDNDEIGAYLAKLVEEKRYESMRQFAREYLKLANEDTDKPSVDKLCNRLSQIKKGTKGIQLKDLPIFTHLLDVTCEELLSAGESRVPNADRMTVAQFAASHSRTVWEEFMAREDKPFLNLDEFRKTALDYALEYKNSDLLDYLVETDHIRCDGPGSKGFSWFFMCQTDFCIGSEFFYNQQKHIHEGFDPFRHQLISIAIEHEKFHMLDKLHARAIPLMHYLNNTFSTFSDAPAPGILEQITQASDKVIDYFSEEFEIPDQNGNLHTYTYPYLGALLEKLMEKGHPHTEAVLEQALTHNRRVLKHVQEVIAETEEKCRHDPKQADIMELQCFMPESISPVSNMIRLSHFYAGGYCSNLISADVASDDPRLSSLLQELNGIYKQVVEILELNDNKKKE